MLPGLRGVVVAILATIVVAGFGLNGLATLQLAHDKSASLPKAAARFAGLAFAERADWTPEQSPPVKSLERLPPFARLAGAANGRAIAVEAIGAPAEAHMVEAAEPEQAAPKVILVKLAMAEAQAAGTPELAAAIASKVDPTIERKPEAPKTEAAKADAPKVDLPRFDLATIRTAIGPAMPAAKSEAAATPEAVVLPPSPPSVKNAPAAAKPDIAALEPPPAGQTDRRDGDTTGTIAATAETAPATAAMPAPQADLAPTQTLPATPPLPEARPATPAHAKTTAHPRKRAAVARPHAKKKKRKHTAKRPARRPAARLAPAPARNPLAALFGGANAPATATQ